MSDAGTSESSQNQENKQETAISPYDAESLEWYFCEGKATFSHSITGPMLSRAELYRHGSYPCYRCDGSGIHEASGDWCKRCNGTGFRSFELYATNEPVTAFPTAEIIEVRGYEPSEEILQRFGTVARRLSEVAARVGYEGVKALEAFHGDSGMRWGRTKHGRIFSIFPLTSAGRRIIQRSHSDNDPVELSDCELLGVQAELQAAQPKLWRRQLMDLALKQAEELYLKAAKAWVEQNKKRRSAPTGERRKSRRERKLEAWTDGASARDCGISFASLKDAAGLS